MEETRFGDLRAEAWRAAGSCSSSAAKAAHMLLNMRCREDKAACALPSPHHERASGWANPAASQGQYSSQYSGH